MSVTLDLDPREVLDHLQALGYNHITNDQLKQFLKDLKKLIKFDLRKLRTRQDQENDDPGYEGISCRKLSPSSQLASSSANFSSQSQAEKPYDGQRPSNRVPASVPHLNAACSTHGRRILEENVPRPTSQSGTISTSCTSAPKSDSSSRPGPTTLRSLTCKKEQAPLKPISSFIRVASRDVRAGKSDPVTLYHHYQSIWARQNRPGENPHADIRWRVRHKMLAPTETKPTSEKRRDNPPWVD